MFGKFMVYTEEGRIGVFDPSDNVINYLQLFDPVDFYISLKSRFYYDVIICDQILCKYVQICRNN